MSGLSDLELFTLSQWRGPVAALRDEAGWGRLCAALAMSCLLHAALFFLPYFGASSATGGRLAPYGGQLLNPEPARILDVRLERTGGPAAEIDRVAQAGGVMAPAPERSKPDRKSGETSHPSRGIELVPVPAPTYYTTDQLSKAPVATSEPDVQLPPGIARAFTGKVILKLWINELGGVDSVEVEQSNLPRAVSGAAAAGFAKLHFVPGEIDGRVVRSLVRIEVKYVNARRQR